jgi:hypothetical protein
MSNDVQATQAAQAAELSATKAFCEQFHVPFNVDAPLSLAQATTLYAAIHNSNRLKMEEMAKAQNLPVGAIGDGGAIFNLQGQQSGVLMKSASLQLPKKHKDAGLSEFVSVFIQALQNGVDSAYAFGFVRKVLDIPSGLLSRVQQKMLAPPKSLDELVSMLKKFLLAQCSIQLEATTMVANYFLALTMISGEVKGNFPEILDLHYLAMANFLKAADNPTNENPAFHRDWSDKSEWPLSMQSYLSSRKLTAEFYTPGKPKHYDSKYKESDHGADDRRRKDQKFRDDRRRQDDRNRGRDQKRSKTSTPRGSTAPSSDQPRN